MSEFNQHLNFYDSKIRSIIVGTLSVFKDRIKYKQFIESNEFRNIDIPFYTSYTGEEDFLYDFFKNTEHSLSSAVSAEGIYDSYPRGVITMTSIDIDSGSLVNKYVRTEVAKKVDDNVYKMYSYETMIVPIKVSFDVVISCSSSIEMFMITEALIETLYKNTSFYINFGDSYQIRVAASLEIPENFTQDKLFEFSFSDKKIHKINFSIEVASSIPILDMKSELFLGDKMNTITNSMYNIKAAPETSIESHSDGSINSNKVNLKYGEFNTKTPD